MKKSIYTEVSAFFRSKNGRKKIAVIALVLLLVAGIASTTAYLISHTDAIKNVFVMATIDAELTEEFDKKVKKEVKVENTGGVDEYVRVCVVINWKNEDGDVYGEALATTDYDVTYNTTDWGKGADGFWYYRTELKVGETTEALIGADGIKLTEAGKGNQPDGYFFSVDLLVQTVQSKPDTAVEEAWGVTVNSGVLVLGGES